MTLLAGYPHVNASCKNIACRWHGMSVYLPNVPEPQEITTDSPVSLGVAKAKLLKEHQDKHPQCEGDLHFRTGM